MCLAHGGGGCLNLDGSKTTDGTDVLIWAPGVPHGGVQWSVRV